MNGPAVLYGTADRPIFIGGLMKSGTSLLRVLLGQHPDLYASFETHWYEPQIRAGWVELSSRRMTHLLRFFDLAPDDYARLKDRKSHEPQREFIDIVLEFCAARAGKLRWAEKTPGNISHYSLIRQQWRSSRFIHVTRDYRDCFASWKTRRKDTLETFLEAAASAYDDVRELLGKTTEHYLEVDHDDIVRSPEQTMRRVLEFAQLDWSPACAELDLNATRGERQKVIAVAGKDSTTMMSLSRPIFTDAIGQWRTMLTAAEVKRIERELAPYYRVFGHRWSE